MVRGRFVLSHSGSPQFDGSCPLLEAPGFPALGFGLILAALLALSSLTASLRGHGVAPIPGPLTVEDRSVDPFSAVSVGGTLIITIRVGGVQPVQVRAAAATLPLLRTDVRSGVLVIGPTRRINAQGEGPQVAISVPQLDALNVGGLVRVVISGLASDSFSVATSGSAHVSASGLADGLQVASTGAADLDLRGLSARTVQVDAAGSAQIAVVASSSLSGSLSGSAVLRYGGWPTVSVTQTGSALVARA